MKIYPIMLPLRWENLILELNATETIKEIENVCLQVSYQLIRIPDEWVGVKENWPHRTPRNKLRKTSHRGHLGKDPHPAEQATSHVLYWVPDVELSKPQNV